MHWKEWKPKTTTQRAATNMCHKYTFTTPPSSNSTLILQYTDASTQRLGTIVYGLQEVKTHWFSLPARFFCGQRRNIFFTQD